MEHQLTQKDSDLLRRTEELRGMLGAFVERDRGGPEPNEGKPVSPKTSKGRQAEEAYRSIFSKTLRVRKENVHRQ